MPFDVLFLFPINNRFILTFSQYHLILLIVILIVILQSSTFPSWYFCSQSWQCLSSWCFWNWIMLNFPRQDFFNWMCHLFFLISLSTDIIFLDTQFNSNTWCFKQRTLILIAFFVSTNFKRNCESEWALFVLHLRICAMFDQIWWKHPKDSFARVYYNLETDNRLWLLMEVVLYKD